MDRIVLKIIEQARSGEHLSRDEIAWLLSFPEESPESLLVVKEAKRLAWERCRGRAFVHAQIGLDSLPCPENCRYCSFAQVNDSNSRECSVIDMDALLDFARLFSQEGANLISLMSTAALPFEKLLSFVAAARLVIDDHVILLVNGPDLSLEQAIELREVGADAAYHAVRLGEGYLTDLDPRKRVQTIENIQAAGLALMSGVEPLWRNAPEDELLDAIERQIALRPVWTGCCSLTIAENCSIHGLEPASRLRARQVGAIIRLAAGSRIPVGGVGGVAWVDAGTDPRMRGKSSHHESLRRDMRETRSALEKDGWLVAGQDESWAYCLRGVKPSAW